MKRVNFYWRLLATAIAYGTFGFGCLILNVAIIPLMSLFLRDPSKRQASVRRLIKAAFRFFTWWIQALGLFEIRYSGLEKIAADHGTLMVGNHPSLIDVIVLIAVIDRPNGIVKKALYDNFFMKGVLSSSGFIPGDRGASALELCDQALKNGDNFIIFPEGTRSSPDQPLKLRRGAAQLAIRLQRPIRLVHYQLSPTTLTKSEKWYEIPVKKVLFSLEIGDKLLPKDFPGQGLPPSLRARRLTEQLTHLLTEKIV